MIPWPDPPIIAAIIAVLGVGFGAWLTWLASGASRLAARIDTLETRVSSLESEKARQAQVISAAASLINRVGMWIEGGMRGRLPQPSPLLHDHIDTDLWSAAASGMTPWSPTSPDPRPEEN